MNIRKIFCAVLFSSALLSLCAREIAPAVNLREISGRSRAPGLSVRLYPAAYMDNLFCVLRNVEQPIVFSFMDNLPVKAKKPLTFKVTIPKGFILNLEYRYMGLISSKKNPDGSLENTYEMKVRHYSDKLSVWGCAFGTIRTDLAADGKKYPLEYSVFSADGHKDHYKSYLSVIPAEKSPSPKYFKSGFIFCELMAISMNQDSAKRAAKYFKDAGFNLIAYHSFRNYPLFDEVKKQGLTRIWGNREILGDGYLMGYTKKPENVKFRNAENKWVSRGLCPEEAANNGPYYEKHVMGEVERLLYKENLGDHYMANWEPIPYSKQGCFCPRCKTAFLKFSGIPEAELNKVWPKAVLKKYKTIWQKFRATRHADIVKGIQKRFTELDKKYNRKNPTYFLPEIALANLLKGNEKYLGDFYAEYDARYYEGAMPAMEPWGPYFMHDFLGAYRALPGRHIAMTMVAEETVRQLKERNKGYSPKLFAFPQGIQCGSWITTPEAIAFETIAFFTAGWEGSIAYAFPDGYDGRYWNALAGANRLIAGHEEFVLKGKKFSSMTAKVISPYPRGVGVDYFTTSGRYFEKELKNGSMLRSFGFQKGKSYCIALANAWERGKAVVELKVPGLSGNYALTVMDSSRTLKGYADGKKLAAGVNVEVPAWSWLFVTITPDSVKGTMPEVKLSGKEVTALRNAAERDNVVLKGANSVPEYRFDDYPSISAGPVSVKPKKGNNVKPANSILTVKAPGYTGELMMAKGGIFSNIKTKSIALKNGSFIGGDADWGDFTGSLNRQPYAFEKWSSDGDEVTVVLKGNLGIFAGMEVEKTYVFAPQKVTVSVRILNTDDSFFMLNYRLRSYWRMTGKPQVSVGKTLVPEENSCFVITSRKPEPRPFRKAMAITAAGEKVVTGFVPGKKDRKLTVDFLTEEGGVYFWRSRDGLEYTAEKTYPTLKLMPGKSVVFSAELTFK